jgi:uncharacterized protein YyaL (SSP411 family)
MATNRLANCTDSPYLLQHKHNPVDWYPWGDEAFQKARTENKPIFLSIGYSSCHWCHVMERESFENDAIADLMNRFFVNIKVDKEVRPDVDRIYMTYVTATTGSGGWPLSVFLTPDLKPFIGGTYFPPTDKYGQTAFPTLLRRVHDVWQTDAPHLSEKASQVLNILQENIENAAPAGTATGAASIKNMAEKSLDAFHRRYDVKMGGFSRSPKFPRPVELQCLFALHSSHQLDAKSSKLSLDMALHTLTMMGQGGMNDHIGGGFARYSVDEFWHVPHFEKMLYDNAQLMSAYLGAYQLTRNPLFAERVNSIFDYVSRDLFHDSGAFYSAQDADSYPFEGAKEMKEGAYYIWTRSEIMNALGSKQGEIFCYHFNIKESGNTNLSPASDPHHEFRNKNVPIELGDSPISKTAAHFQLREDDVKSSLASSKRILLRLRHSRPPPRLDDKILTSWNAMMISACAQAAQILPLNGQPSLTQHDYLKAAIQCAESVEKYMIKYSSEDPNTIISLKRGIRFVDGKGVHSSNAFADDYTLLIGAFLDLYEATGNVKWLKTALQMDVLLESKFSDPKVPGLFSSNPQDDPSILLRIKEFHDGAEPSANSVHLSNLARLAILSNLVLDNQTTFMDRARALASTAVHMVSDTPSGYPLFCRNALLFNFGSSSLKIIVFGASVDDPTLQELLTEIRSRYLPMKMLVVIASDETREYFSKADSTVKELLTMQQPSSPPTVFICEGFTCKPPVSELSDLVTQLNNICGVTMQSPTAKSLVKQRRVTSSGGTPKPNK